MIDFFHFESETLHRGTGDLVISRVCGAAGVALYKQ
jgi:hypothetical protein